MQLFAERGVTQITVSELAQAAGIARGTIYNNVESPETLFESVAADLANEMMARTALSFAAVEDPAQRLSNGIRYFLQRTHEEPLWGRFITRFALSSTALQGIWGGPPTQDVVQGLASGVYDFKPEQLPSVIGIIAGSVLSAMFLVLEGHKTWREAGADVAELVLRGMGVPRERARAAAVADLPPLAALP